LEPQGVADSDDDWGDDRDQGQEDHEGREGMIDASVSIVHSVAIIRVVTDTKDGDEALDRQVDDGRDEAQRVNHLLIALEEVLLVLPNHSKDGDAPGQQYDDRRGPLDDLVPSRESPVLAGVVAREEEADPVHLEDEGEEDNPDEHGAGH